MLWGEAIISSKMRNRREKTARKLEMYVKQWREESNTKVLYVH